MGFCILCVSGAKCFDAAYVLSRFSTPMSRRPSVPGKRSAGPSGDGSEVAAALALRQFRQIFNAVKTHFQQMEKTVGLGGAQVWALSAIAGHDDLTIGGLAGIMDIHQTTASNLVKLLVERDLIEANRSSKDARIVCLALTKTGAALLRKVPGPFAGVLPDALMRVDPQTIERLNADLAEVLSHLKGVKATAAKVPLSDL